MGEEDEVARVKMEEEDLARRKQGLEEEDSAMKRREEEDEAARIKMEEEELARRTRELEEEDSARQTREEEEEVARLLEIASADEGSLNKFFPNAVKCN